MAAGTEELPWHLARRRGEGDAVSKAESLFAAEAHLRAKAVEFANWSTASKSKRKTLNETRHELRIAALEYARIANEIDGAP